MVILDMTKGLNHIGRLGENEHRTFRFPDSCEVLAMYPEATVSVLVKRPGDSVAYPVAPGFVEIRNGAVYWTVQSADLARIGRGNVELTFVDGTTVAKNIIYDTYVDRALDGAGDPPEPWESWQTDIAQIAGEIAHDRAEAGQAAEDAAEAQRGAEVAQGAAESAARDAEGSAGDAASSARAAGQSVIDAGLAQDGAEEAQRKAETAQGKAEDAQSGAEEAQGKAETAKREAEEAAETAATSERNAAGSVTDAAAQVELAKKYVDGKGTDGTVDPAFNENNANYLLGLTRQVKDEAETLVGDLAKEATLREVESEAQQSVELLEQILAEGHSSGDLNGYSLAPGAGNEVILTYTDPETEEASSVIMITNTTGQAIADALEEEMLMWKELVENAS